jgi:hypothetical protein
MKSIFLSLTLMTGALVFSTFESSATVYTTVAFSTLDSSGGYMSGIGPSILGSSVTYGYQGIGNEFAPTVSGEINNIGIAVSSINQPDFFNVQLVLDNGGNPTGPILASGSVMTDGIFGTSSTALSAFTPSTSVFLTAGTDYWLLITPHSSSSQDVWNYESSAVPGNFAVTTDGLTWAVKPNLGAPHGPLSGFQVIVDVPEPSYLAFALGGLVLIVRRRRIFRVAVTG